MSDGQSKWYDFLFGVMNQAPGLVLNADQLATQIMQESGVPPMVLSIAAPLVKKLIGRGLDALTGTTHADIRASDLLGSGITGYSYKRLITARQAARQYDGFFKDSQLATFGGTTAEELARTIYGGTIPANSVGYGLIAGVFDYQARQVGSAVESVLDTLASDQTDISYGGKTFRLGTKDTDPADAKNFATYLANTTMGMLYGDREKGIQATAKSLSTQELGQVISDALKNNKFVFGVTDNEGRDAGRDELTRIVRNIDAGVAATKSILGSSATLSDARMLGQQLFGTDLSARNAAAFNGALTDFARYAQVSGITAQDVLGDRESGISGTMEMMANLTNGLGFGRDRLSTLAIQLAAQTKGKSSGRFGVTDAEYRETVGRQLVEDELLNRNRNYATALQKWAMDNGRSLDPDKLADTIQAFEAELKTAGITDLGNSDKLISRFFNGDSSTFNIISRRDTTRMLQSTASAYANKFNIETRRQLHADLTDEVLSNFGLGDDDQKKIRSMLAEGKSKADIEAAFDLNANGIAISDTLNTLDDTYKWYGLDWNAPARVAEVPSNPNLPAKLGPRGIEGITKYLTEAKGEATLEGLVAAALGIEFNPKDSKTGTLLSTIDADVAKDKITEIATSLSNGKLMGVADEAVAAIQNGVKNFKQTTTNEGTTTPEKSTTTATTTASTDYKQLSEAIVTALNASLTPLVEALKANTTEVTKLIHLRSGDGKAEPVKV